MSTHKYKQHRLIRWIFQVSWVYNSTNYQLQIYYTNYIISNINNELRSSSLASIAVDLRNIIDSVAQTFRCSCVWCRYMYVCVSFLGYEKLNSHRIDNRLPTRAITVNDYINWLLNRQITHYCVSKMHNNRHNAYSLFQVLIYQNSMGPLELIGIWTTTHCGLNSGMWNWCG